MKEILDLALGQPQNFYWAAIGVTALVVVFDMYRSARANRRTVLGRVLGYAPKPNVAVAPIENVTSDQVAKIVADAERKMLDHLDKLRADTDAKWAQFEDAFDHMARDVEWLASERMIDAALNMAKQGAQAHDIAKTHGLSQEEAILLKKMARH